MAARKHFPVMLPAVCQHIIKFGAALDEGFGDVLRLGVPGAATGLVVKLLIANRSIAVSGANNALQCVQPVFSLLLCIPYPVEETENDRWKFCIFYKAALVFFTIDASFGKAFATSEIILRSRTWRLDFDTIEVWPRYKDSCLKVNQPFRQADVTTDATSLTVSAISARTVKYILLDAWAGDHCSALQICVGNNLRTIDASSICTPVFNIRFSGWRGNKCDGGVRGVINARVARFRAHVHSVFAQAQHSIVKISPNFACNR
ncbi:hypothetical protein FB547_11810 [Variovorax beijingensis]|uniref:Uncharacterized protein n=1 Tax=Variovorax beijingensis TaxID=2496117 RepID=A0A561B980_9BURK|nr:hypothetical protein FB547_11810 [Variovorax beijingensis]